jgi:tetratricopeptide (TPR) repeat protein
VSFCLSRLCKRARIGFPCCALMLGWMGHPDLAAALGVLEKNHPIVEQGRKAYEKGDYQEALRQFDAAKKDLPSSASLDFNRGNALFKLGRMDEANQAYHRALETERSDLKEKDYYNLGNVWAQMGNVKEAVAAYRKALTLDPKDEEARHNLEVVLREQRPPDGGTPRGMDGGTDGGSPDGGRDGGSSDGGSGQGSSRGNQDGGQDGGGGDDGGSGRDGGTGPQEPTRSNRPDGGAPPNEEDAGSAASDGGVEEPEQPPPDGGSTEGFRLNKQDAERLLDSIKRDEKNLQLWKFQQKKPRRESEKDW